MSANAPIKKASMLDRMKTAAANLLIIGFVLLLMSYTQDRDERDRKLDECMSGVAR